MAARQLTWWHQLNSGQGGSNNTAINVKGRRQRHAHCHGGKWWRDRLTGGISSAMVGVAVTRTTAMPKTTMTQRLKQQQQQQWQWGALGSTREQMWQLRSAKGQPRDANAPLKDKILIWRNILYQVLDKITQYNILYHTT